MSLMLAVMLVFLGAATDTTRVTTEIGTSVRQLPHRPVSRLQEISVQVASHGPATMTAVRR